MSDVYLVTCAALPEGEPGGRLLVDELAGVGLSARWVVWDDPAVEWSSTRLVAVRSTWDYERRRTEFLRWAGRLTRHLDPAAVLNGEGVFRWNTDKTYLLELLEAGLAVVPTTVAHSTEEVAAAVAGYGPSVLKPTIGAGGRGVHVLDASYAAHQADLGSGPWLVQPLVESVRTEGETSVFVVGGRACGQARKVPASGEIRVHEEYGGHTVGVPLTDEHRALAERAVSAAEDVVQAELAYARVDTMRLADGTLVVGEVEATEPGLYLEECPENAAAFARMVAARLDDPADHT